MRSRQSAHEDVVDFVVVEIFENLRKNGDRLNRYNDREAGSVSCEARTSRSKETSGLHW